MSALKAIPRVNEYNEVIGETTIPEAVQNGWPRRFIRVYLFDTTGKFLLQQRSATIIGSPNLWDGATAGHVDAGESDEETAYRELAEEIGVTDASLELIERWYQNENNFESIFRGQIATEYPFVIDPKEVATVAWVTVAELDERMTHAAESFVPPFVQVWKQFHDKLIQY